MIYMEDNEGNEKKMATHSSTLAWEIPWKEVPGGLHGVARVGHDLATKQQCGKIISYIALLIYVHCNNSISENLITNLNSKEERQKEQGRTEGLWESGFLF